MAPWLKSRGSVSTFMVKPCYIYGCSGYYIHGQILLHMWLVDLLHLWFKIFTFMVSITFIINFYYFYVGITLMVVITFMVIITSPNFTRDLLSHFNDSDSRDYSI